MSYKAYIRNNATGETRIQTLDLDWRDSSVFWWTDGNFGCDCNRELEFRRAGGETETDIAAVFDNIVCGHTRYSVPKIELQDGTIVEIDRE